MRVFRNCFRKNLSILIVLILGGFAGQGASGQYLQQCQQASKASVAQCTGAEAAAQAGDAAQSAALGGMATTAINPNTPLLTSGIQGQLGRLAGAQATCEAAKKQCESQCDQAKSSAQAACRPQNQQPCTEAQQIPSVKQSQCTQPIQQEIEKLKQAQNNLKNDQNANDNTKNASDQGAPPSMPPMSPPPGGSEEPKEKEDDKLVCSDSSGVRYSDCNDHYVKQCPAQMGSDSCTKFSDRYCNLGTADAGNDNQADRLQSKKNYVVDKKGEGMGSEYCKLANAHRFCQVSGRSECPSCQNLSMNSSFTCVYNPSSCRPQNSTEQIEKARSSCPSDPMFLDPNYTADNGTPSTSVDPTATDNNSSTAQQQDRLQSSTPGSSGSSTTAQLPSTAGQNNSDPAMTEGQSGSANTLSLQTGSGGGGGGGSSFIYDATEGNETSVSARKPAGASAATPAGAVSAEVAGAQDMSLFSISSQTYKALCEKKQLKCQYNN